MEPSTLRMVRAWLVTASLCAAGVDATIVCATGWLRLPPALFETAGFRGAALIVVIVATVAVRLAARLAFDWACTRRFAACEEAGPRYRVAHDCPLRWLVVLYLRFARAPYTLAER